MRMGPIEKLPRKTNIHSGTPGGKARRHRIEVDYRSALDKAHGKPDKALDLLVEPGGHAKQRQIAKNRLEQLAKTWVAPQPVARHNIHDSSSISSLRQLAMNMGSCSMNNSLPLERDNYTERDVMYNFPPINTSVRLTSRGSIIAEGTLTDKWLAEDGSASFMIDSVFYNTRFYSGAIISW